MKKILKRTLALSACCMLALTMLALPSFAALEPDKIKDSITTYTRDDFGADMEKAAHTAQLTFEDGTYENIAGGSLYVNNSIQEFLPCFGHYMAAGAHVGVSGTNGKLGIYFERNESSSFKIGIGDKVANYALGLYSGKWPVLGSKTAEVKTAGTNTMYFQNVKNYNTGLKPVAVGYAVHGQDDGSITTHTATVQYSDGTTETATGAMTQPKDAKVTFFGFKAPEGKYIVKVTLAGSGWFFIDDIAVIMEELPAITVHTEHNDLPEWDELNFFSEIANGRDDDADGKTTIKATAPAGKTGATTIIAVYGEGGKLVAVKPNLGNESSIDVPKNGTYTKVAAYVWDMDGMKPLANKAVVENE